MHAALVPRQIEEAMHGHSVTLHGGLLCTQQLAEQAAAVACRRRDPKHRRRGRQRGGLLRVPHACQRQATDAQRMCHTPPQALTRCRR